MADEFSEWTDPEAIQRRYARGQSFAQRNPGQGAASPLAGLVFGITGGLENLGAHNAAQVNKEMERQALAGIAGQKNEGALAQYLMGSKVPHLQQKGLGILSQSLDPARRQQLATGEEALKHARQMNPLTYQKAQAELAALKRNQEIDEDILRGVGLLPPKAGEAGAASPSAPQPAGAPLQPVPGVSLDYSGGAVPPAAAPPAAAPAPAPQQGSRAASILASRPVEEQRAWGLLYRKDPKKAAEQLLEWANPNKEAEKARQKEVGEAQGKFQVALPEAIRSAELMKRNIDALLKDKSLDSVVGVRMGHPWMPTVRQGSADAEARIRQVTGGIFMQAFQSLKGGGSITETEGAKATQSLARLQDTRISPAEYRKALKEFKQDVEELVDLAKLKAEGRAHEWKPKPRQGDPLEDARAAIAKGAPRDKVIERLRQNGIDPAGL